MNNRRLSMVDACLVLVIYAMLFGAVWVMFRGWQFR